MAKLPELDFSEYKEPSRKVGAILFLISAVIAMLVSFGISVTPEQQNSILMVVLAAGAVLPLVQSEWIRAKVFSKKSVQDMVDAAYDAGKTGTDKPDLPE